MNKTWGTALLSLMMVSSYNPAAAGSLSELPAERAAGQIPGSKKVAKAVFAGGCFWSMEKAFRHQEGVLETVVGYAGGSTSNPTYEEVNTGQTGHLETVEVTYDAARLSYEELLDLYWHNIDPVDPRGQFCDIGEEYKTAIFTGNSLEEKIALNSRARLTAHFKKPITTQIKPLVKFWLGEEYHQHFAEKNPGRYGAYRIGCGRDRRLRELWGDKMGKSQKRPIIK